MIAKVCAGWLVVLALSPFTAPFSTCELTILFGSTNKHSAPLPPARRPASSIVGELAPLVASVAITERAKVAAQSVVPASSVAGSSHSAPMGASADRTAKRPLPRAVLRL